jgi:hypothetical protein|tara:strand:+ start:680 stop:907 length:228 start_codon:yes stop_codon:yes gene_type:complete
MSKPIADDFEVIEAQEEQDIGAEDYGFVFDSDGNLKYAFVPEAIFDNNPPKIIKQIMKLLDVTDLEQFNNDITLH